MTKMVPLRLAVCCDCGKREMSRWAGPAYRCNGCTESLMGRIRALSDMGMSQGAIGDAVGLSQNSVFRWCAAGGIKTKRSGEFQRRAGVCTGFGAPPEKMMPSKRAMGLVSVFRMVAA